MSSTITAAGQRCRGHFRPLLVGELHWNLHRESPPQAAQRQCQTRPVDAKSKEISVITHWDDGKNGPGEINLSKTSFSHPCWKYVTPFATNKNRGHLEPHPLVKIQLHGALDWKPTKDGRLFGFHVEFACLLYLSINYFHVSALLQHHYSIRVIYHQGTFVGILRFASIDLWCSDVEADLMLSGQIASRNQMLTGHPMLWWWIPICIYIYIYDNYGV